MHHQPDPTNLAREQPTATDQTNSNRQHNRRSIDYMGLICQSPSQPSHALSSPYHPLRRIFSLDAHALESLLATTASGGHWSGLVRMPGRLDLLAPPDAGPEEGGGEEGVPGGAPVLGAREQEAGMVVGPGSTCSGPAVDLLGVDLPHAQALVSMQQQARAAVAAAAAQATAGAQGGGLEGGGMINNSNNQQEVPHISAKLHGFSQNLETYQATISLQGISPAPGLISTGTAAAGGAQPHSQQSLMLLGGSYSTGGNAVSGGVMVIGGGGGSRPGSKLADSGGNWYAATHTMVVEEEGGAEGQGQQEQQLHALPPIQVPQPASSHRSQSSGQHGQSGSRRHHGEEELEGELQLLPWRGVGGAGRSTGTSGCTTGRTTPASQLCSPTGTSPLLSPLSDMEGGIAALKASSAAAKLGSGPHRLGPMRAATGPQAFTWRGHVSQPHACFAMGESSSNGAAAASGSRRSVDAVGMSGLGEVQLGSEPGSMGVTPSAPMAVPNPRRVASTEMLEVILASHEADEEEEEQEEEGCQEGLPSPAAAASGASAAAAAAAAALGVAPGGPAGARRAGSARGVGIGAGTAASALARTRLAGGFGDRGGPSANGTSSCAQLAPHVFQSEALPKLRLSGELAVAQASGSSSHNSPQQRSFFSRPSLELGLRGGVGGSGRSAAGARRATRILQPAVPSGPQHTSLALMEKEQVGGRLLTLLPFRYVQERGWGGVRRRLWPADNPRAFVLLGPALYFLP